MWVWLPTITSCYVSVNTKQVVITDHCGCFILNRTTVDLNRFTESRCDRQSQPLYLRHRTLVLFSPPITAWENAVFFTIVVTLIYNMRHDFCVVTNGYIGQQ